MTMKNETFSSCEWFWRNTTVNTCVNVTKEIIHEKKKPNCTTIPKYNCVERWENDTDGNQVGFYTQLCYLFHSYEVLFLL